MEWNAWDLCCPRKRADTGRAPEVRGREVGMGLPFPYRSLAEHRFPNAEIVADRFPIIKWLLSTFTAFCRDMHNS